MAAELFINKSLLNLLEIESLKPNITPPLLPAALFTKEQLSKMEIVFKVKTGTQDRVFGSISSKQIKEELEKKNINIDKKQIILDDGLSSLGYHDVKIELYKDVIGIIKVKLEK